MTTWLWLLLLVVLLPLLFALGVVVVLSTLALRRGLYYRRAGLRAPPISWGAWGSEAWSSAKVVVWAFLRVSPRFIAGQLTRRPVLCLHGLSADATSMAGMQRGLRRFGLTTRAITLGRPGRRVVGYAPALVRVLHDLARHSPDGRVDIVAHSMGGIVLRAALQAHPDVRALVGDVVTVASPHRGTGAARGVPLPEARDLAQDSPWLLALPTLHELLPDARLTSIASSSDAIVYPQDTSHFDGATHINLDHLGHAGLVVHDDAVRAVAHALGAV
jgi:pimeloyl-ACP methyl ester carboxylesterase